MPDGRNRLGEATSPYLRQHAANPVHWWEWGAEAFAEAKRRDVPVLLSVGYASCHWCHVMAHESFESAETADTMNRLFVNVKVDREERPDVDRIYMDAVQVMTGRGGWPMTVFLTPDGRPFHAGTYYPPEDRHGFPSFTTVMEAVDTAWRTRRGDIDAQADRLTRVVREQTPPPGVVDEVDLGKAAERLAAAFDPQHGGFGSAPKFPQVPALEFLLRTLDEPWAPRARSMLETTLSAMADGGIHDLIGGGFSRYTVDDRWLVPHFEKMLYDNAQLARIFALASRALDSPRWADVAESTLAYMTRDLGLPDGGFASGEDADSEGVEGRFYVFDHEEFVAVCDDPDVATALGVTRLGTFEGKSILHRARPVAAIAAERGRNVDELEASITRTLDALGAVRSGRVRPERDDKVVCAWNGLAIRALADAGRWLDRPHHIETARRTATFVLSALRDESGRLQRSWREGRISGPAYCDDYAALALGLFSLFAATGEPAWFHQATDLTREMVDRFLDPDGGGFWATGSDAEPLIARPKNVFDSPTPSDNALAAEALQLLAAYAGDPAILQELDRTLTGLSGMMQQHPLGAGHALAVLTTHRAPMVEVAVVGSGPAADALVAAVHSAYRPHVALAVGDGIDDHGIPLLAGRSAGRDAAVHVCHAFVCAAPAHTPAEVAARLA